MKPAKFRCWLRLAIGIICLIVAIVYMCQLKNDTSTLENAVHTLKHLTDAGYWFFLSVIWIASAVIFNNQDRINELEKRIEVLEASIENKA